jgi:hypothetical protein
MAGTDPYGLWFGQGQGIVALNAARKILRVVYPPKRLAPGVYWGTRDLAGPPSPGNHHYLLIVLAEQAEAPEGYATAISPTQHGFILAGYNGETDRGEADGMLVHRLNAEDDVAAVREYLRSPADQGPLGFGWDAKLNPIAPPDGMTEQQFVEALVARTKAYVERSSQRGVRYRLGPVSACNCATWVDGLLRSTGVSSRNRLDAGEFHGTDWGEENGHMLDDQFGWEPGVLGGPPRAPMPSAPIRTLGGAGAPRYY